MPVAACERIEGSDVKRGAMFSRTFQPVAAISVVETGLGVVLTAVTSIVSAPAAGACIVSVSVGNQSGDPPAGCIKISIWRLYQHGYEVLIGEALPPFPKIDWIAIGDSK